jgi:hypothetical protein
MSRIKKIAFPYETNYETNNPHCARQLNDISYVDKRPPSYLLSRWWKETEPLSPLIPLPKSPHAHNTQRTSIIHDDRTLLVHPLNNDEVFTNDGTIHPRLAGPHNFFN